MAVYKSKRGESSAQFIETARQLEAHTLACCMKAPKRYSFLLTQRIMDTASEVHDHVRAANVTTAGQMTFTCAEAPTANITVNILRIEVSA